MSLVQARRGVAKREPGPMSTQPATSRRLTHRLILPRDANHHGTLYAGSLLALVLEAGYATAYRAVGQSANLVLKRVLDLRCYEPVRSARSSRFAVRGLPGPGPRRGRAPGTPLPDRPSPGRIASCSSSRSTKTAGPSRSPSSPITTSWNSNRPGPHSAIGPTAPGDPGLTGRSLHFPGNFDNSVSAGPYPRSIE